MISTILFRKELLDRDNKIDPQQLKLNGSVLVRSEELQSIDSIALAVPVPVITGKRRKQDKNGMVAHLFPTKNELMDSEVLATSVRYVAKLLRKLLVVSKQSSKEDMSDVAARLKDPHLLLFLQDYIDAVSFRQLCSFVIQDFGKKPLSVEVALSIDNAITMLDM